MQWRFSTLNKFDQQVIMNLLDFAPGRMTVSAFRQTVTMCCSTISFEVSRNYHLDTETGETIPDAFIRVSSEKKVKDYPSPLDFLAFCGCGNSWTTDPTGEKTVANSQAFMVETSEFSTTIRCVMTPGIAKREYYDCGNYYRNAEGNFEFMSLFANPDGATLVMIDAVDAPDF